jgi:hypothetical protein
MAAQLIAEAARPPAGQPVLAASTAVEEPLTVAETAILAAAAPLTDGGPVALKRLYNAYRLARTAEAPRPLTAVMVAALQSSRADYIRAIEAKLSGSDERLEAPDGPAELGEAFQAAIGASETRFTKAALRAALAAARLWTPPAR